METRAPPADRHCESAAAYRIAQNVHGRRRTVEAGVAGVKTYGCVAQGAAVTVDCSVGGLADLEQREGIRARAA